MNDPPYSRVARARIARRLCRSGRAACQHSPGTGLRRAGAGKHASHRDSEARLALGWAAASPPAQRCFDTRSAKVASAAAAGLEAIASQTDNGAAPNPAAIERLERELAAGLDSIDQLFSL